MILRDLETARQFYCDVLGATQGRSTDNQIDLDFYGHHVVIHEVPKPHPAQLCALATEAHAGT